MADEHGDAETTPEHGSMDQLSAHIDRGWDLVQRGDFAGAQASAEKSLEIDAESPEAYNLLGYARAALGDHDGALEHYRYAIALDDTFVEAMLNAAEVLIHPLHDFDAAREMVDEALDFAEGDDEVADAMLVKFDAYLHQGDREGAIGVLHRLPTGPFEAARIDFLVGRAHHDVGEDEAACGCLERAVERDPANAEAHYCLGLSLDALGRTQAATLALLRSRELDLAAPRPTWALPTEALGQLARRVVEALPAALREALEGALVVIADLPGPETIADGVDPRAAVLLDATSEQGERPRVGRMFVYARNIERSCDAAEALDDELAHAIAAELAATFPSLRAAAGVDPEAARDPA